MLRSHKTATQLDLRGFAESLRDEDVRLCKSPQMCDSSGVKEVDVTGCNNETVLRTVVTRA